MSSQQAGVETVQQRSEETAQRIFEALRERGETLAFCESLTAGLAAATMASVPGVSAVLRGGLVTYATEVKAHFLHSTVEKLEAQGVVAEGTAAMMAQAAVRETQADWGIGLTGVAGPDLQEGKPAGTVWIGIAGPGVNARGELVRVPAASRQQVRTEAVAAALNLLLSTLLSTQLSPSEDF